MQTNTWWGPQTTHRERLCIRQSCKWITKKSKGEPGECDSIHLIWSVFVQSAAFQSLNSIQSGYSFCLLINFNFSFPSCKYRINWLNATRFDGMVQFNRKLNPKKPTTNPQVYVFVITATTSFFSVESIFLRDEFNGWLTHVL